MYFFSSRLLCFVIINPFVTPEWIEISQNTAPFNENNSSSKNDFNTYLATISSTSTSTIKPPPTPNVLNTNGSTHKSNERKMHVQKHNQIERKISEHGKIKEVNELHKNTETNNGDGGFFSYLSSIQNLLVHNSEQSKSGKIGVLKTLRDNLLLEIEERIGFLWNPKSEARSNREYKEVEFPSNEGALMTIGFLTFAVFLIKLVLHLVQVIGNKYENNGTVPTYFGRRRRSVTIEQIKILDLLENFKYKNP